MTEPVEMEQTLLPEGAACALHRDATASFVCTRCGTFGCGECVFSAIEKREVCKACAAKGLGEPIPWERRKEIGTWTAFWKTAQLVSRKPTAFFRTPTTSANIFGAVAHGTASVTLGMLLTYLVYGLMMMLGGGATAYFVDNEMGRTMGAFLGIYGCVFAGMSPLSLVMGPANALMGIVVAGAGSHGTLALFKKTRGSFEDTLRALSYANAPMVWSWIPVIGTFTYFWMIGVEVVALRETHGCGTDWAVAAAVGYRLVLFILIGLLYAALVGWIIMLGNNSGL